MTRQKWTDHYAELELVDSRSQTGKGPASTADEIKQKRNDLVKRFHPDKYPQGTRAWQRANARCIRINTAYEVLGDPDRKRAYDEEWLRHNAWFEQLHGSGDGLFGDGARPTLYATLDWLNWE